MDLLAEETQGGFDTLPVIVLREILKMTDKPTIMNSRLVCVKWNEVIEDTSQLMKYLKFPVRNAATFLDLQIVKKGKVRSIILKDSNLFDSSDDCKQRFMDLISNTIEIVEFAFEDENIQQQSKLFKLILENCCNLKEIKVQGTFGEVGYINGFFQNLTTETTIASANKINLFSICMYGISEQDVDGLIILILQLPKLKEIVAERYFFHTPGPDARVVKAFIEYIQKYKYDLHLKKLTLGSADSHQTHRKQPEC